MRKLLFSLALFGTLLIPEVALTRPVDVNVSIRRQGNETYSQFLERANSLAKNTIEQRFKTDRELDALNVVVVGENNGAIAPLLAVKVNRDNWQANPNVQKWSNEFPFSQSLLGLESVPNPTAPSAAAAPPPSAPPSDQPDAGDNFLPTGALLPEEEKTPVSWPDRRLRVGNGNPVRQQEESLNGPGVTNLPPRN